MNIVMASRNLLRSYLFHCWSDVIMSISDVIFCYCVRLDGIEFVFCYQLAKSKRLVQGTKILNIGARHRNRDNVRGVVVVCVRLLDYVFLFVCNPDGLIVYC